jgi:RHS repeat-associated protein
VTDQAGKPRRSLTDALGRLTRVDEPNKDTGALGDVTSPVQPTSYSYDALDDLKTVTQGGQSRSFFYDSLKRLTSATNPESGTVNYTSYDGNGNLLSKIDARGMTTNYVYDALNRLTNKTYQNDPSGTPAVSYTYDATSVSNSKGRLTQVSTTVSATNYTGYDAMGRVTASSQSTNGQTYLLGYGYNLAGGMTSETYPSGRTITTAFDAAGRINGVTGSGNKTYASSFSYWPHGAVSSMTLGNNLIESTQFNSRLQPTSIGLGSLATFAYTYGTSNNNGNVLTQQIIALGLNVIQGYCYDKLNRLTGIYEPVLPGQCQTSGWSQTYDYDQYGNRTNVQSPPYLSNPPTLVPPPAIDSSTNRFQAGTGFGYDNAGNLTQAPGGVSYSYDAENRLTNFGNGTATYAYDGDGRRVKKTVQSANTTTVFVYNVQGQLVAEYCSGQGCNSISGTEFLTADHLGSTRVVTDASGGVISRHDYLPFGEAISAGIGGRTGGIGYEDPDGINQKFTGKERDSESGLDYFGARYCSSNMGRFTSPDPISVSRKLLDPQTLNKYSYTFNRPTILVDPDGKWPAWYHHVINQDTFGNLGDHAVEVINAASDWVDSPDAGNQAPERSFMHAMSDGTHNQTVEEAMSLTENYISTELGAGVTEQMAYEARGGRGFNDDALTHFGHAVHTVEDRTSPEHVGYQPWSCFYCWSAWKHHRMEERSARSSEPADAEARHNAHIAAAQLWNRFMRALQEARKEEEVKMKKKEPKPRKTS